MGKISATQQIAISLKLIANPKHLASQFSDMTVPEHGLSLSRNDIDCERRRVVVFTHLAHGA